MQVNVFDKDSNAAISNNDDDDNNNCVIANNCTLLHNVAKVSKQQSLINLIDASFGQIALALVQRTRAVKENWLLVLVGDGNNEKAEAPLYMAAYSRGELVQLQKLDTQPHYTTQIYTTILKWFNIDTSKDDKNVDQTVIGLCSDGIHVRNCQANNTTTMY